LIKKMGEEIRKCAYCGGIIMRPYSKKFCSPTCRSSLKYREEKRKSQELLERVRGNLKKRGGISI